MTAVAGTRTTTLTAAEAAQVNDELRNDPAKGLQTARDLGYSEESIATYYAALVTPAGQDTEVVKAAALAFAAQHPDTTPDQARTAAPRPEELGQLADKLQSPGGLGAATSFAQELGFAAGWLQPYLSQNYGYEWGDPVDTVARSVRRDIQDSSGTADRAAALTTIDWIDTNDDHKVSADELNAATQFVAAGRSELSLYEFTQSVGVPLGLDEKASLDRFNALSPSDYVNGQSVPKVKAADIGKVFGVDSSKSEWSNEELLNALPRDNNDASFPKTDLGQTVLDSAEASPAFDLQAYKDFNPDRVNLANRMAAKLDTDPDKRKVIADNLLAQDWLVNGRDRGLKASYTFDVDWCLKEYQGVTGIAPDAPKARERLLQYVKDNHLDVTQFATSALSKGQRAAAAFVGADGQRLTIDDDSKKFEFWNDGIARRAAESGQAWASPTAAGAWGQNNQLGADLYLPSANAPKTANGKVPLVIDITGGGFFSAEPRNASISRTAQEFVDRGAAVVAPEYHVSGADSTSAQPVAGFPAPQLDMLRLYSTLEAMSHDPNMNFDMSNITLIGGSAGGTLALDMAMMPSFPTNAGNDRQIANKVDGVTIKNVIALAPGTDAFAMLGSPTSANATVSNTTGYPLPPGTLPTDIAEDKRGLYEQVPWADSFLTQAFNVDTATDSVDTQGYTPPAGFVKSPGAGVPVNALNEKLDLVSPLYFANAQDAAFYKDTNFLMLYGESDVTVPSQEQDLPFIAAMDGRRVGSNGDLLPADQQGVSANFDYQNYAGSPFHDSVTLQSAPADLPTMAFGPYVYAADWAMKKLGMA